MELSASVLSLDLGTLASQVSALDAAGIDSFHLDIMDGHFVPNLTFGPATVKALRRHSSKPFHVHMMVEQADVWLDELAEAGADSVSVHVEASVHLHRTLGRIRALGMESGVSINPGTSLTSIEAVLSHVDCVLLMSVDPGFGGQDLIEGSFQRAVALRERLGPGSRTTLAMDGGLREHNLPAAARSGVTRAVVGSSLLGYPTLADAVARLKAAFR